MSSKLFIKGKQLTGAVANALKINCKDKDGNKSTVQAELNKLNNEVSEQNKKIFQYKEITINSPAITSPYEASNGGKLYYHMVDLIDYIPDLNEVVSVTMSNYSDLQEILMHVSYKNTLFVFSKTQTTPNYLSYKILYI